MTQQTNKKWFFVWLKKATKALEEGTISATTFAVLVVLSQCADYDSGDNARPGNARLARLTGLSEGTVSNALKEGRAAGLLQQVRRGFSNAGAGSNSLYRMDWSATAPAPASAPSNIQSLPSADRGMTERSKSHGASSTERPRTSRRVRKPSSQSHTAAVFVDEPIQWSKVGLTDQEAQDRNLSQQDFDNYLALDEERGTSPTL